MVRPLKKESPLVHVISFRATDKTHAFYVQRVAASGYNKSEFFREILENDDTKVVQAKPRTSLDKQRLLYLFNKTSNNINQLAHRANADHLEGKTTEATYRAILTQLDAIAAYMKASLDHVD